MGDFVIESIGIVFGFLLIVWACRVCCRKRTNEGVVISTTPVVITSEVHRVATGAQAAPSRVVVHGHPTGTAVFPPMPSPYPAMPAPYPAHQPYPAQPYPVVQQYPAQSGAPVPPQDVHFPALPPMMQHPIPGAPPAASGPAIAPPSYDQAMSNNYAPQAPYNPDFKSGH